MNRACSTALSSAGLRAVREGCELWKKGLFHCQESSKLTSCKHDLTALQLAWTVLMGFCTQSQALLTHKLLHNPNISRNLAKGQWSVRYTFIYTLKYHAKRYQRTLRYSLWSSSSKFHGMPTDYDTQVLSIAFLLLQLHIIVYTVANMYRMAGR